MAESSTAPAPAAPEKKLNVPDAEEVMLTCRLCEKAKPESAFAKREAEYAKQRGQARCARCRNLNSYLQKAGVPRVAYDTILKKQDSKCAMCKSQMSENGKIFVDTVSDANGKAVLRALTCAGCKAALKGVNVAQQLKMALYLVQIAKTDDAEVRDLIVQLAAVCVTGGKAQ